MVLKEAQPSQNALVAAHAKLNETHQKREAVLQTENHMLRGELNQLRDRLAQQPTGAPAIVPTTAHSDKDWEELREKLHKSQLEEAKLTVKLELQEEHGKKTEADLRGTIEMLKGYLPSPNK